jgi:2-polyprenyl-3-methyl-5-hydroxy-6-metoxy-1,4-benzoquinol methylase
MNAFVGTLNDKDCFNTELNAGIHLDNESYMELFKQTAQEIVKITGAKTFLDCGGGMGAYTLAMLEMGADCTYVDLNQHHVEYVGKRLKPIHDAQTLLIYQNDFTACTFKKFDVVASIEVMEHIPDAMLIPFLKNIKCDYFHFSSTPHTTDYDEEWGHINIKQEDEWIELFTKCGFTLHSKVGQPTPWSLIFTK